MDKDIKKNGYPGILIACLFLVSLLMAAPAAHSQEPVKIACIAALTGIVGPIGQSQLAGAKVAEMHINEDGGILGRKIVIIDRDTAASPATGVKVVREAVMNENVKFFVGGVSSAVALAVAPLMEQLDSIFIIAAAASPKLTGVNCNPHVFRTAINIAASTRAAAKLAVEKYPNVKRWAGLNPDYEYGHSCWENFSKELKRLDPSVTIVEESWPKFMSKSFEPEILKILQAKPEGLYTSLYSGDFITFVKQGRKYKFFDDLKVLINHSVETDVSIPLGAEMVDCWGGGHYYPPAYDNPITKRFIEGHKKLYNALPIYAASEAYSAVYAFKYAVEKAKSFETKAVIQALRGLTYDTVSGKRTFRPEDNQVVQNGIFLHFVPTKEAPGWKVEEIRTFWSEPFLPKVDDPEGGCKMKW